MVREVLVLLLPVRVVLLHHRYQLIALRWLVQETADNTAAAADRKLGDPDPQDQLGVVSVDPTGWLDDISLRVLGWSRTESTKLALGVEAEDGGRDDGAEVDAPQETTQAEAEHASVQIPRAYEQAQIAKGNQEERDSAELVNHCEARCCESIVCGELSQKFLGFLIVCPLVPNERV